jgi:hypothetical protein
MENGNMQIKHRGIIPGLEKDYKNAKMRVLIEVCTSDRSIDEKQYLLARTIWDNIHSWNTLNCESPLPLKSTIIS